MDEVRVQEIAKASKNSHTIPLEFVLSKNEQPHTTTSLLEVPLVDLRQCDDVEVVEKVAAAASKWGIFQVVNHGIECEVIEKLQTVGKEFFEGVSQEEKEVVAKTIGSKSVEGYGTKLQKEVEGKKGWVDHLFHKVWPPNAVNYRFWPQNPPDYREANEVYVEKLRVVADKLLEWLSLGLGLEGNALKEASGGDDLEYMLKINYYPPCPRPDLALGVAAHTDMCSLTILVPNEVQGLQVYKDDYWYDVKYIPNALIVHIGDQIEIISNGKYKAVFHRSMVNKDSTRMSWPVFLEPPSELKIGPCQQLISRENPPKFKTKKFKDYMNCKLNKLPQ